MRTPVLTVKNVKTFDGHDGVGVNADIYIDGVYVGHLFDDARGGEMEFSRAMNFIDNGGKLPQIDKGHAAIVEAKLDELETYAKALPEIDINADRKLGKSARMYKQNSIDLMDAAVNKHLEKKVMATYEAKKKKLSAVAFLVGKPDETGYKSYKLQGGLTFEKVAKNELLKKNFVLAVYHARSKMEEGEVLLNEQYLKDLGFVF